EAFAVRIAECFGLSALVDGIIGPGLGERQPEKEHLIRRAMAQFPGPYVMVGDRVFDVEGARRAGIPAIFAVYGYGQREEAGDALLAYFPEEILDLLLPEGPRARGLFLSMEGVDGCGKSTQQRALVEEMKRLGWRIVLTREPGGDEIAEKIRQLILDPWNTDMQEVTEAYLYAASRAQNARMRILPALEKGKMVICDRYVDSSIAYQGGGRQLGAERIRELNAWATENCMPDLTVYLRMEPHEALARRLSASEPDRLEQEEESFFVRTFEAFEKLYQGPEGRRVLTVNAARPIEAVTEEMLTLVRRRLAELTGIME
ncbi:MAG: dTMP kinase, partial [Clostridia bacterium]|nr:dTMP kinase [Clostridia bacterium]